MLLLAVVVIFAAPERALPGSSLEPARSLGLMFASRTLLLSLVLIALAARNERRALAWVLFADAAFQVFDTGLSLSMGKGALSALPALICLIDAWAARTLQRVGRDLNLL
jgi:hypothetical protein